MREDRSSYFVYTRGLELDAREAKLETREAQLDAREAAVKRKESIIMDNERAELVGAMEERIKKQHTARFALGILKRQMLGQPPPPAPILEQTKRKLSSAVVISQEDGSSDEPPVFEEATDTPDPETRNAVHAEGVIYTTILNPYDLRKNWRDMITAYCAALRDADDATLVIKVSTQFITRFSDELIEHLRRLHPFSCRIVIIKAFLDGADYDRLLLGSTYYVNTSFGEGQCLPLMEALSIGMPAIAPKVTAMEDYVSEQCCFVPATHVEPTQWQHDPRQSFRTRHHRVDWPSLVEAFQRSYYVAKNDAPTYKRMSDAAKDAARGHNSMGVLQTKMAAFLDQLRNRGAARAATAKAMTDA